MNIAKYAVTRPVAVTMQIAALVLLGAICLTRLPVDLLPKVSMPTLGVSTSWPNVAPEEIESQITRPVEQTLSSVPGVIQVSSTSSTGSSSVRVQFTWGTDIGQAAIDVMQRLERVKRRFPDDSTIGDPTVNKFDPNSMPVLTLSFSGIKDPVQLRSILDNEVSPIVESADGVASVSVSGGRQRNIIVDVDPIRLRAHHLALPDIMRRLVQENINAPGGVAKLSEMEYTIRTLGWLTTLDEIRNIPLVSPNGQTVTINDVAEVRDAFSEVRSYSRMNGEPSASLSITKQSDANTISSVKAVMARMKLVERMYPQLKYVIASDQSKYIQNSVNDLLINALIGATLAILILLFFLRNVKSTLVVALSIPISIVSTFALLYLCGFTLNTMSLSGLALATGLIVDDAVVVLENIFRHIERDKRTPREAAIQGTNEILSAVVASTWTVMVVFLPLLLIKGQSGQMFMQFALVVIFSLAVSLLDAATVVPMLANRLISGEAHAELMEAAHDHPSLTMRLFVRFGKWFSALDETYRGALNWALHHRWQTVGGAVAITAAAMLLLPQVGTEMMPQTDSGEMSINVKLPPGTALEKTDQVMQRIEKICMSNPNVETVLCSVGGGGFGGGGGGGTGGSVNIKLKEKRTQPVPEIMDDLRKKLAVLPGIRPRIMQRDIVSMMMTGGNQSLEIDIFGNDLAELAALSREVMGEISDIKGLQNVDINWQEAMPEVQWKVDRQKAIQLGVSFQDIANTLSVATSGSTASYYQEKGYQYPIVVQLPESDRKTIDQMSNLVIATSSGKEVVLSQVAHPVFANGPNQITRQNRQRFVAVNGSPQGRNAGDIQKDVEEKLAKITFPAGYHWEWGTDQQRRAEEFAGMGLAVILAIGIIYMLLAAQFESFTHPLSIMLSVPLAGAGVVLGLFLTGRSFGLTALIGMLMLVGIVVKNGILLVDYTNTLRKRGMKRDEAVLTASPTRLRPILMTASAAALGMLPIALALGKGSEIQAPMATAVIGGLLTSTFLTLFVVPVVYTLLDDVTSRRNRGTNGAGLDDAEANGKQVIEEAEAPSV